jgi:sigma-B regulation protein RsbU (phosphoserine phosphatase)
MVAVTTVSEVHSLTIRNDHAEVARALAWVDDMVGPLELSPEATYAIQLCLEEAVVNIISYAFEPGTEHNVRIEVWRDGRTVFAEIIDDGQPFDPRAQQVPQRPANLDSAQIGGLGITLIRNFATDIAYRRTDGTNRLTLSFAA